MKKLILTFICLFWAIPCQARTIYVDGNGPANFNNIQAAIDDANDGDIIEVRPGTYTGNGNRDIDFLGKAITVRSIEPNNPNIVAATIIDCENYGRGFYFHTNETTNSMLQGLTITKGYADHGGAIYSHTSSATISNCIITGNRAIKGGGIICKSGNPTIINCVISNNTGSSAGGGIYSFGNTVVRNCIIKDNSAYDGGAIYGSGLRIRNCFICDNKAGIHGSGGGIVAHYTFGDNRVSNSTIVNNSAGVRAGGILVYNGPTSFTNCIIWDNTAQTGRQISLWSSSNGRTAIARLSHSDIKGGEQAIERNAGSIVDWGLGNMEADPCFVFPFAGDYHLMANSPCINAGDPNYAADIDENDIDGEPRVINDRIDIGADETNYQGPTMGISATEFQFHANWGHSNPQPQILHIRNKGISILNWEVIEQCNWLQVDPNSGSSTGEIDEVALNVDITGLTWGTYDCVLTISDPNADNSPQIVQVNLVVKGPTIEISADEFEFVAFEDRENPVDQTLTIHNSGGGTLNWTISHSCDWLQVDPNEGNSTDQITEITLCADITGLNSGTYNCTLTISATDAENSPQTVEVNLVLYGPAIELFANAFEFAACSEGPNPENQTLLIRNSGGGTLHWQITADCNWLEVWPLTGQSTGEANEVILSADISGLEPNVYSCELSISDHNTANSPQTVEVNLVLYGPAIELSANAFEFAACSEGPNPENQTLFIRNSGGGTLHWEITADCNWLEVWPLTGQSTGEANEVILSADISGLEPNDYSCELSISDRNMANSPQTVQVFLYFIKEYHVPSPNYPTIQSAIDAASYRDIVVVEPNIYKENINLSGKSITVTSINPDDQDILWPTIIDANRNGRPVTFNGNETAHCELTGFTIIGGYTSGAGGGILGNNTKAQITKCTIMFNQASDGGGLAFCDGKISNCLITDNHAVDDGGGLYECDGDITNCTIAMNAAFGGAGAGMDRCNGKITNCIFQSYFGEDMHSSSNPTYSCWMGATGTGNIDADPRVNYHDYHLQSEAGRWEKMMSKSWIQDDVTSPCIDAGDPNSDWTAELWPHGKRINMGAYGGTTQASMSLSDVGNIADLNNDDKVDFSDLLLFTDEWINEQILLPEDLNRDGFVDFADYGTFAENWNWH